MSYRNDHDAALSRIDALESELAQLREKDKPRARRIPAQPPGDHKALGIALVGAASILCAIGFIWRATSAGATPVVDDEALPEVHALATPVLDDDACIAQIEEWAVRDARAADPRNAGRTAPIELMRGAAACGSAEPSAALDNVASLITVYYESDPVTLDGYATAEQLWREYHRARAGR